MTILTTIATTTDGEIYGKQHRQRITVIAQCSATIPAALLACFGISGGADGEYNLASKHLATMTVCLMQHVSVNQKKSSGVITKIMADELIEKMKQIEPALSLAQIEVAIQMVREHDADNLYEWQIENVRNKVKQEAIAIVEQDRQRVLGVKEGYTYDGDDDWKMGYDDACRSNIKALEEGL